MTPKQALNDQLLPRMDSMSDERRIIVALDYSQLEQVLALADQLDPASCRLKVGKELFTAVGPEVVRQLQGRGFEVFLDLKFHDIPNTTAQAVLAAADMGVWMCNVHASGGRSMLETVASRLQASGSSMHLIAVTVLTSLSAAEHAETGLSGSLSDRVADLTELALQCGLDGVVCSAQEAQLLRQCYGAAPLLVTPGIRPSGSATDDQARIMTPQQALAAGASYLVIGRPITQADHPAAALQAIQQTL